MSKFVYMDNSATTRITDEVFESMKPYLTQHYGNPSSIYSIGRDARAAVDAAREKVAKALNAPKVNNIYFTASGTEADNWAIKGYAFAHKNKGNHIISSAIEHHAVLHTLQYLEKQGFEVTYLPVDANGLISLDDLEKAIKPTTIMITIMTANNEIGTIEPIAEIGKIAHDHKIVFHTDAVQAIGNMKIDVQEMNIDMLSMSAHKIHGPKGVGALYVKSGIRLDNLHHGGAQESNKRAGTENVAGIVGLGTAIESAMEHMDENIAKMTALRDRLIKEIEEKIPYCRLNGDRVKRLPTNVNFSFKYIEGESILLMLDINGIAASSGSACTSGSLDPSHVLLAIGLPHEIAHGSTRFSLSNETTSEDVDYVMSVLPGIVERLRKMSPLYEEISKEK